MIVAYICDPLTDIPPACFGKLGCKFGPKIEGRDYCTHTTNQKYAKCMYRNPIFEPDRFEYMMVSGEEYYYEKE